MIILALDTAASVCAACIYDSQDGAERSRVVLDLGKGHSEHVMAVLGQTLERAGFAYSALDAIAVSVGPGSFTGVRVGVSAARGLALALGVPAIGISTLEAVAAVTHELFPGRPVLAVIGNRPESLYAASFDASCNAVGGPEAATLERLAERARAVRPVLAGDAAGMVAEAAGGGLDFGPQTATADILAYARIAAQRAPGEEKPKPLYLRAPDAKPQSAFALPRKGK